MSLEHKYSSIPYKSQVQLKINTGAAILRTSHTTALKSLSNGKFLLTIFISQVWTLFTLFC
jgi:hypothetical protein